MYRQPDITLIYFKTRKLCLKDVLRSSFIEDCGTFEVQIVKSLAEILISMVSKFLFQVKESTTRKEIRIISKILEIDTSEEEFIKRAEEIAFNFLNSNELINPITLARSSCYLALKQYSRDPETQLHLIRNNNGHENKWFVYLAPIIEKELETMR